MMWVLFFNQVNWSESMSGKASLLSVVWASAVSPTPSCVSFLPPSPSSFFHHPSPVPCSIPATSPAAGQVGRLPPFPFSPPPPPPPPPPCNIPFAFKCLSTGIIAEMAD